MKRQEYNRLKALVKTWRKEAKRLGEKVDREREHAGHSNDENGTGDEGWRIVLEDQSTYWCLVACAQQLEKFLLSAKIDEDRE